MQKTLAEVKALVTGSLGSPKSNQNAATALAGTEFTVLSKLGTTVTGTILPNLSSHNKVQARFTCAVAGCDGLHDREQSDWHQAHRCRPHSVVAAAKMTPEQKQAKAVERAKALIAASEKVEDSFQGS